MDFLLKYSKSVLVPLFLSFFISFIFLDPFFYTNTLQKIKSIKYVCDHGDHGHKPTTRFKWRASGSKCVLIEFYNVYEVDFEHNSAAEPVVIFIIISDEIKTRFRYIISKQKRRLNKFMNECIIDVSFFFHWTQNKLEIALLQV